MLHMKYAKRKTKGTAWTDAKFYPNFHASRMHIFINMFTFLCTRKVFTDIWIYYQNILFLILKLDTHKKKLMAPRK